MIGARRAKACELVEPRAALGSLYGARVTDHCLDLLGAQGDVIVEGPFARNAAFCSGLAALRAPQPVRASRDVTGTASGAALLARWPAALVENDTEQCAAISIPGLAAHRERWRAHAC